MYVYIYIMYYLMQWHSFNCKCPDTVWGHFPAFAFPESDNDKWMEGESETWQSQGIVWIVYFISQCVCGTDNVFGRQQREWWTVLVMWPAISVTLEINAVLSFDHSYNRNWWKCHTHTHTRTRTRSHTHHTTQTHTHTHTQTHTHTLMLLYKLFIK